VDAVEVERRVGVVDGDVEDSAASDGGQLCPVSDESNRRSGLTGEGE
jgi:hypothetical protein